MKILIIEDQEKLAQMVQKGLKKEGFAADYLLDGEVGQKRIEMNHSDYDLIILDLMMPKKSGFEVCKNVRDLGITTPILVLTARDSTEDKVALLDMGADDYLVKPFSFKELLARIRALTRRPETVLPVELKVRDIILNPVTKKVQKNGEEVKLTLKEFRLLEFLMRNAGQVVDREKIVTNIWDFDFNSFSNIMDVYINHLRNKIGDKESKVLETVRGIGYRLNV